MPEDPGENELRRSSRSNRSEVTEKSKFPQLVSLAAHDLRTPLATVSGFAKTLIRTEALEEPASRYVEIIDAAAGQMVELLDELGLAARIEAGRYQPNLREADTLALARDAAATLGEERVRVGGEGGIVRVDLEATQRAVTAQAQCALRHGGLELVDVTATGPELTIAPITPASAPVVLGDDLRDLGAAVAALLVRALGGSVSVEDETLHVRLPE
jgi:signal transduction histidine kinase